MHVPRSFNFLSSLIFTFLLPLIATAHPAPDHDSSSVEPETVIMTVVAVTTITASSDPTLIDPSPPPTTATTQQKPPVQTVDKEARCPEYWQHCDCSVYDDTTSDWMNCVTSPWCEWCRGEGVADPLATTTRWWPGGGHGP